MRAPAQVPVITFDPSSLVDGAGERVGVDLQTLIATRLLITGDSRSGKSRMARQILEQTYGQVPHLVIDPEGDFATLRERYDYLLVGRGGELAADVATAAQLASSLFQLRANAIVDLSDLKPKVQREYVAAFIGQLTEIHQSEGHPTLVVVDEAQFFAPEGGKSESHDALWNLSRRGGKRGLCLVAIPQRLAELSKEVAGGLQNRLVFTTTLDGDIDRASKMLGLRTREQKAELERLPRGHCFAYGPAIGDHRVQRVRGVDATATTHPDVTKGARPAPPPPRESLNALVAQLRQFEQTAKTEAREIDRLRARVQDLEANAVPDGIRHAQNEQDVRGAVAAALQDERVRQDRYRLALQGAARGALDCLRAAIGHLESLDEAIDHKWISAPATRGAIPAPIPAGDPGALVGSTRTSTPDGESVEFHYAPRPDPEPAATTRARTTEGGTTLAPHQQAMLDALAWLAQVGDRAPTKAKIGALIGLAVENRMFRMHFAVLRRRGLVVDVDSTTPALTEAGRRNADPHPRFTHADVTARWLAKLDNEKQRALLARLLEAFPHAVPKRELGRVIGVDVSNRIFRMHFSVVRKLGVIEDNGGDANASPLLFQEGLR